MNIITKFQISERQTPKTLYRIICSMSPFSVRVDDFCIEASTGETLKLAKIAMLVALCKAAGIKRSRHGDLGTYGYYLDRQYDEVDYEACDLLCFHGLSDKQIQFESKRDKRGRLILLAKNVEQMEDFGQVKDQVVVSQQGREALEAESFGGLVFHDVEIYGRQVADTVEACWELGTTNTMPKLANTDMLMCYGIHPINKEEPFNGDYSKMLYINEPPYLGGELHYRSGELRKMGNFDIANTYENLWYPGKTFVVTSRLYHFFKQRGIAVRMRPVRIDSD